MGEELRALESNKTWLVVPLPLGKSAIGCKQVYKTKFKADGAIERQKAHLVAKGYAQQEGVDFFDIFLLVAKLVMIKLLFFLVGIHGWPLTQLDIGNVFLHGDLVEEVYMDLPPRYVISQGGFCNPQ